MVNEKIKKSSATLAGVVFSILIVMAIFFGFYLWIDANRTEGNMTMNDDYSRAFTQLQTQQGKLNTSIEEVKSSASSVVEADNTFQAAWNGLKGLITVAKVPFAFVGVALGSFEVMTTPLTGFLPSWAKTLINVGLIGAIIFIIWSIMKGDPNVIR